MAEVEALGEDVGHGDEFGRPAGGPQRIGRSTRAAPAAADQGDLDDVVLPGMNLRNRDAGKDGRRRGSLDRVAARHAAGLLGRHEWSFLDGEKFA